MSARDLHQSVRPSPIFLAIVGVTVLGAGLAYWVGDDVGPLAYGAVFVLVIAGWVVSLCLHEFGHAFTAWRFGDRDVALRGYLNMDPRRYVSPVWSILVPIAITAIGGIGLPGAAVYVRTSYMTTRQGTLVSLAGPAANLVLAVLLNRFGDTIKGLLERYFGAFMVVLVLTIFVGFYIAAKVV